MTKQHDALNINADQVDGEEAADIVTNARVKAHFPDTIANILSNHTQAVHNALNIDAATLETHAAAYFAVHGGAEHDAFSDFVGDEHIPHSGVTMTAGTGLTGGGAIEANRTFNVDVGITINKILKAAEALVINDYAKVAATGLIGRTYAQVLADLSGQAGAPFDWNDQSLSGITDINVGAFPNLPSDENLVGYLSFDDGAGAVAVDNSGHGNDGTFIDSPSWADGIVGNCLDFDGADDSVSMSTPIIATDSYTISFWMKSHENTEGTHIFEGPGASSPSFEGTDTNYRFYVNNTQNIATGAITPDQWYYIACVWNESTGRMELFVDAVSKCSLASTTDDAIATLYLASKLGRERFFDGLIDEVRIYDKVLTAEEIKALYLYPAGNKGQTLSIRQSLTQQAHIVDAPGDTTANNATTINAILVALETVGILASA